MSHKFVTGRGMSIELEPTQRTTLVLFERIGGAVSLVAVLCIFVAYALVPKVRNVQNTFIVFASVANVGASVASIIALDGLDLGVASPLCQAQSFMFHMFMQSDPWWSLAMAFNVFLVFFFRAKPDSFRRWWWIYCLICYGGPFAIAMALLLVRTPDRGLVFGEATDWEGIRIYTYYMLVWVCIAGSIIFYFMVGYHVFHTRNQLKSLTASMSREPALVEPPQPQAQRQVEFLSVPQDCFYGTIVTEVQVVHSTPSANHLPSEPKPAYTAGPSSPQVSFDENPHVVQGSHSHYFSTSISPGIDSRERTSMSPLRRITSATNRTVNKFVIDDPIKRAYLRTSFLFALSVLVTWIPSSLNRIHSWLVGTSPYEYHVATAAVLPLQGLWNAVIFFVTSGKPLREWYRNLRHPQALDREMIETRVEHDEHAGRSGESFLDDTDSGSDVELRRMGEAPGKRSASL
ncbi:G coupled receptor like [Fusarium circinatum]|uniref:G coupled receptor like n=1 Tax=Fusarium circinatum TaxID=48490 RepID=A0A8H5WZC4_FUSCI|nr:G coupled receptor like [Fusarium circinatum]